MCGICGRISPAGVAQSDLRRMTDALSHRGPDDWGEYVDGMVGLGHRRLSIIDLTGGHQPISNKDNTMWIVFNGEIYNYQELRQRLGSEYEFKTNSDTEVILHLYEEMGPSCVDVLRGMFAFAIWDSREESLFIARDHLGQKPLFYCEQGGRFSFASEIKGLLAAEPTLRQMNPQALHQYLTLRVIAPPRTMFAGVHKLPPGHTLMFKNGRVEVKRFWHIAYQPKLQSSEADIIEELNEQMLEAVRYHMVSDVPVGAFLSGGLDSGIIVGMMSKVAQEPIKTFSVGVPYEDYSELPYAKIVSDLNGTEHFEETVTPSLVRVLPELIYHLDEPSDPLSASMYYIAEMARREVKVVLGGDGGDELFGGYDRYYGNGYVNYYAMLPAPFRKHVMTRLLQLAPEGFWYKSLSHKLKWMNQLSFAEGGRRYSQSLSYFYFSGARRDSLYGDGLLNQLAGFDPEAAIYNYFDCNNATDYVDKMLFADSMVRLPDHSVMILDRTTMAHGLEARSPFMDHKLAEYVAQIPTKLKVNGRTLRYIQQKIGERYLPPEILNRKKQGFTSALTYILADEYRYLYDGFMQDAHLVRDGYLRQEAIDDMFGQHLARKVDHGNRLWLLCNSELWYRMAIEDWSGEQVRERLSDVAGTADHVYPVPAQGTLTTEAPEGAESATVHQEEMLQEKIPTV